MCTASWKVEEGGYRFLFSRDEQRSRPRAEAPSVRREDGVTYLSPRDPQAGGTWVIVNEFCLTVAVLNHYAASAGVATGLEFESRGLIPINLATCRTLKEVDTRFRAIDLDRYNAFHLLVIDRSGEVILRTWDRSALKVWRPERRMITTSSVRSDEVQGYREQLFDRIVNSSDRELLKLEQFHLSAENSDLGFNPLMSRSDAETQCFGEICVGEDRIDFKYSERVSDGAEFGPSSVISI